MKSIMMKWRSKVLDSIFTKMWFYSLLAMSVPIFLSQGELQDLIIRYGFLLSFSLFLAYLASVPAADAIICLVKRQYVSAACSVLFLALLAAVSLSGIGGVVHYGKDF